MDRKSFRKDAIWKLFLLPVVFITAAFNCNPVGPSQPARAGCGDVRAFCVSGPYLFAGTYYGGVFRSTANGENWTAVNAGLPSCPSYPSPCVLALAVSGNSIFAGIGIDQGIFRSTNNGESWEPVDSGLPVLYPLTNLSISALIVRGCCIFAGTNAGIFLSANNGESWTDVSSGLTSYESSGYMWKYGVSSFAECGGDLFAGTYGDGVFRLTHDDNGLIKWTSVSSGLDRSWWCYASLAVSGKNIFAATFDGVFLSTDNGANWKPTATFPTYSGGVEAVFASKDESRVFASSQWDAFFSTNNGARWTQIRSGLSGQDVRTFFQNGSTIFAGTQVGGIFRSTDNGENWTAVNSGLH
jgi:photosystem II stability/assembly factor-like uncharacterized protein